MGRPAMDPRQRRTERLELRLNAEEVEEIDRLREERGTPYEGSSRSEMVRIAVQALHEERFGEE